jgi:DNA modification methylase
VLDLFAGAGTTLIAAERTGRTCRALELDPHYCDIVLARWEAFSGETAQRGEASV